MMNEKEDMFENVHDLSICMICYHSFPDESCHECSSSLCKWKVCKGCFEKKKKKNEVMVCGICGENTFELERTSTSKLRKLVRPFQHGFVHKDPGSSCEVCGKNDPVAFAAFKGEQWLRYACSECIRLQSHRLQSIKGKQLEMRKRLHDLHSSLKNRSSRRFVASEAETDLFMKKIQSQNKHQLDEFIRRNTAKRESFVRLEQKRIKISGDSFNKYLENSRHILDKLVQLQQDAVEIRSEGMFGNDEDDDNDEDDEEEEEKGNNTFGNNTSSRLKHKHNQPHETSEANESAVSTNANWEGMSFEELQNEHKTRHDNHFKRMEKLQELKRKAGILKREHVTSNRAALNLWESVCDGHVPGEAKEHKKTTLISTLSASSMQPSSTIASKPQLSALNIPLPLPVHSIPYMRSVLLRDEKTTVGSSVRFEDVFQDKLQKGYLAVSFEPKPRVPRNKMKSRKEKDREEEEDNLEGPFRHEVNVISNLFGCTDNNNVGKKSAYERVGNVNGVNTNTNPMQAVHGDSDSDKDSGGDGSDSDSSDSGSDEVDNDNIAMSSIVQQSGSRKVHATIKKPRGELSLKKTNIISGFSSSDESDDSDVDSHDGNDVEAHDNVRAFSNDVVGKGKQLMNAKKNGYKPSLLTSSSSSSSANSTSIKGVKIGGIIVSKDLPPLMGKPHAKRSSSQRTGTNNRSKRNKSHQQRK
eukprot:m.51134 g.51134  ORF g.51134 m.51134 type:complete len:697 (+) comp10930_c0_seq1:143-2233(+)